MFYNHIMHIVKVHIHAESKASHTVERKYEVAKRFGC